MSNLKTISCSGVIITLSVISTLLALHPTANANGNLQATSTQRTFSTFGSGFLQNSVRSASLGGPGGGGGIATEVVIGTCESQEKISSEADNYWSLNQETIYINDEGYGDGIGYDLPYPNLSVAYCGNQLDIDDVFITLTTPRRQVIALFPKDGNRFEYRFGRFHTPGKYLLNIRNSDFQPIQHPIDVVRVSDGYQGFRLSIVDPSTGKHTAWVQRGKPLHVDYYSPTSEQIIEASLYPPTHVSSDQINFSEYDYPSTWNLLFHGSLGGSQALFRPYDLSALETWTVKADQTRVYSETLIFPENAPLGMYSLMAGEPHPMDDPVDHLEPSDASGNLISTLDGSTYYPIGTDYLYQLAVLNYEPLEYTSGQNIPLIYVDAYGAKYAAFVLNVKETIALQTGNYPVEVIVGSHGNRIQTQVYDLQEKEKVYILPGPDRYLILLSELTVEGVTSFNAQSVSIDQYVSQLIQKGKQAFRTGELDIAIIHWRKAVELKPELTRVHNLLCWAKGLGGSEYSYPQEEEAFSDCYKAVTQAVISDDPRLPLYYDSRGIIYAQMGKLAEAATDFKRYLTKYPNNPKRQYWVTELLSGRNPFVRADKRLNEDLLQELQKEPI